MKQKRQKNFIQSGRLRRAAVMLCLSAMLCRGVMSLSPLRAFADGELEDSASVHVHTEECYSIGRHLVCGLEESPGHQHTDACYALVRSELLCMDDTGDHIHTDDCYYWHEECICGLEEGEGAHIHTEDCYEEERILACDMQGEEQEEETGAAEPEAEDEILNPEEDIWEPVEEYETGEPEEVGDPEEEAENPESDEEMEDDLEAEPIVGPGDGIVSSLPLQRELCFSEWSDPNADVEDEITWWRMFSDMELSGNWAEDLLQVAESQIGYTESETNYVAEDPWYPKGYTRYGAWYGLPYADWCAMFISFCMYYAEIPSAAVPYNCHCSEWVRELSELGLYRNWDEGYSPKRGDFIFFDFDMDEKAEHVGIIEDVDEERGWIYTIEGNRYDYVEQFVLTKNDYSIIGYCELPENPNYNPYDPGVVRSNGRVEIPPDPVEPEPPSWENFADAASGIKSVEITPRIEATRVFS